MYDQVIWRGYSYVAPSHSPVRSIRRFVTFGVVYGILRRIHRYPVCVPITTATTHTAVATRPSSLSLASMPLAATGMSLSPGNTVR
jgi:hypothetical protein